ncbi:MAG: signal recognition particle-docking protein FtsY [Solobacterium sp.]|nr:signal recognition particle-docking protein FtsY [Solobacterium sp.]
MSFLDTLRDKFSRMDDQAVYLSGFSRTRHLFGSQMADLRDRYARVDDEFLEYVTIVLLQSDVGIETADIICERLEKSARERWCLSYRDAVERLVQIMKEFYEEIPDKPINFAENGPTVILLEGVNGSGKTTTAAKLARMYLNEGRSVAFTAADTFRAGAIDQLAEWGSRLNIPCVKGRENGDPSAAIVDGCRYAKENGIDILLCDTAGRLQNKQGLMAELSKMNRVASREIEGAPHNTWLILDATTGQNGLAQAEIFNEASRLDGIILTKMDGTAKGGIVLAIKHQLELPVFYLGLGEQPEDLRPFDLDAYLYSLAEGMLNG